MAETNEQKISRMVKVLRKSCFEALDHYKRENIAQNPNYSDLNWTCRCGHYYYDVWDQYDLYNLDNYENDSPEHTLVKDLLKNESIEFRDAVTKNILNEWIQKEESERIAKRVEQTKRRIKETRRVAAACGVSAEVVLLAELREFLYAGAK